MNVRINRLYSITVLRLKMKIDFSSLFVTSAHAFELQENDLYDCAMRSLGITVVTEAYQKGISSIAGKKAFKKAIIKVG